MTDGHERHMTASLLAMEETIQAMTAIGRDGRSPTSGQRLAPLPPGDWQAIALPLQNAAEALRAAISRLAPDGLRERERSEGLGGTLFRLSILLRHVEEEIAEGLDPLRMERQFGDLSPDEREALADLQTRLQAELSSVRARLEALSRQRQGG